MARRVFFSFHYKRDIWRANIIRNSHIVEGTAAAGFQDASLWEETKRLGDSAVKRLIDDGLAGTSVTVVLIRAETAYRKYVDYEIEQSIARGNGLFGMYIHGIENDNGVPDLQGLVPRRLTEVAAPVYHWDRTRFGTWVEDAYRRANSGISAIPSFDFYSLIKEYAPPPQPQPSADQLGDYLRRFIK